EQAFDIRIELRPSLLALGTLGRVIERLLEAEALAEALNDRRRLAWVASLVGDHYWQVGDNERAATAQERALGLAVALGDWDNQAAARSRLGRVYWSMGGYPRALELLDESIAAVTGDLVREYAGMPAPPAVASRVWAAWCLAERGDFSAALDRA